MKFRLDNHIQLKHKQGSEEGGINQPIPPIKGGGESSKNHFMPLISSIKQENIESVTMTSSSHQFQDKIIAANSFVQRDESSELTLPANISFNQDNIKIESFDMVFGCR